jgi:hypothetical protein
MAKRLSDSIVATNGNGFKPQISPMDEFPAPLEETIFVELSTGRIVEMVIGELSMFYELGRIPDELKSVAAKILFTSAKDEPRAIEKRYFERLELAKWTVSEVLRNNTVPINRFYHDEIWEIYNYANDPARAMENFRLYKARHVGLVSDSGDILEAAEPMSEGATLTE